MTLPHRTCVLLGAAPPPRHFTESHLKNPNHPTTARP
ncbi:hypothetical protein NBC2815_01889 [Xanthomonas fragariae]|nr:hypothetical protein NBC2815_01889 [Xanthomonas fragariae]